jgi:hypothetical protein
MKGSSSRLAVLAALVATTAAACSSFSGALEPTPGADGGDRTDGGAQVDGGTQVDGDVLEASVVDASDGGKPQLVAFVTTVGYSDIVNAASADAKCTAEASGRVSGKFVAWFSQPGAPAPARLLDKGGMAVDGPWYRLDGMRIVATRAALSSTASVPLENPINVNAAGVKTNPSVWTGTHADGTLGAVCPAMSPTSGSAGETGIAWTDQSFFTATCGSSLGVYCFQVD